MKISTTIMIIACMMFTAEKCSASQGKMNIYGIYLCKEENISISLGSFPFTPRGDLSCNSAIRTEQLIPEILISNPFWDVEYWLRYGITSYNSIPAYLFKNGSLPFNRILVRQNQSRIEVVFERQTSTPIITRTALPNR
ncbi:MAG: hypothetical protein LBL32_02895 [Holosporales bacterium]|jgi:hypothetical protein|nr:hypothetical protein [Holosporales bacterium]